MSPKLLKVPEVAYFLDVTKNRVYELIRLGVLPSVKLGRQVRVSPEALHSFIAGGGEALDGGWRKLDPDQVVGR